MDDLREDEESKAFRDSIEESPDDNPDFGDYTSRLAEACSSDFTGIEDKNCVGYGNDSLNRPCIYLIPALALQNCSQDNDAKIAMMRRIMLLFIKYADRVVNKPYTLVYGHSATPLLAQTAVLHSYYKILPRKYKKNLKEMILLHPTFGVRTFFEISRYFVGEKFFRKLHFVSRISQLQRVIKPTQLPLPFDFIAWEEQHLKVSRPTSVMKPLTALVASAEHVDTPQLLLNCVDFLRKRGGLNQEGIFRVPGDQIVLNLAVDRLRIDAGEKLILFELAPATVASDRASMVGNVSKGVKKCGGADEFATLSAATNLQDGVTTVPVVEDDERQNFTEPVKAEALSRAGPAVLLIQDVNSGAQIFKSFLKELPEPVLCFAVYDDLISASRDLESGGSLDIWRERVFPLLASTMPPAHGRTLEFVLKFLAEVSLSANINKMTPHNLAIIFSPNMMRPRVDNPVTMVEEMKLCVKTVETLLVEHMNESLKASIALPSSMRMGMSQRFSNAGRSSSGEPSTPVDNADSFAAMSILNEKG